MNGAGLARVPISWNEVGWPTRGALAGGRAVPEVIRAAYLYQVADADLARCGVTSLAPHTWVTVQQNPTDPEDWFGIANPVSAQPYPTALAYSRAARAASAGSYSSKPCE